MDINNLKVDVEKASEGVWFELSERFDGATGKVKIARWQNSNHVQKINENRREYRDKIKDGKLPEKYAEKAVNDAFNMVLTDWDELTDKGKPWKYTANRASKVASDESFRDFYNFVVEKAVGRANYRPDEIEDSAKNS